MSFEKFSFKSLDEIKSAFASEGSGVVFSDDLSVLSETYDLCGRTLPNRLAYHPMEGADGERDGSPSVHTLRRYERFARGGAGLIWFEAVAVMEEGRANPLQLWIHPENVKAFKQLNDDIRAIASETFGEEHRPLIIAQLTHSGRFSRPFAVDQHDPIISYHNPYLNQKLNIPEDHPVLTDAHIDSIRDAIISAAGLALEAGFDGVDIKCCHRYITSELCSAYEREGRYGGSFENRTRLVRECVAAVKKEYGDKLIVGSRLNVYDGIPYPYGFGTDREDFTKYDFEEPIRLISDLCDAGLDILNITMGTPYYNSHVNRPFDTGLYTPSESQITGVSRMICGIGEIAKKFPELPIVGTGYSWLREYGANAAAGSLKCGMATIAGFGRQAFAYPDFARDICENGCMDPKKVCIACGKCSDIMRLGNYTGCVVRDGAQFVPMYKKYVAK